MNVMQHLLVHLPYEAEVGGLVQYRWMYFVERDLKKLKATIGNKTRVEGCIAEAFYLKEISHYTNTYFAEENNIHAHIPRYTPTSNLKLFQRTGKAVVLVWSMKCAYKNGILHCCICTQIWRRWKNISCKYHDIYLICESRLAMYLC
jgi:hypothetical protein